MKGGAVASKDVDDGYGDVRGLGSPASVRRDGGVEDGEWVGATAQTVAPRAPASGVPPVPAPPIIAAAGTAAAPSTPATSALPTGAASESASSRRETPHTTSPAPARRAFNSAVADPTTAWLRGSTPRQEASLFSDVSRSLAPATPDESRVSPDAELPSPTVPVATGGGTAAAASGPPPPAAYAMFLTALALAAAWSAAIILSPARKRPVPFISLLERPG